MIINLYEASTAINLAPVAFTPPVPPSCDSKPLKLSFAVNDYEQTDYNYVWDSTKDRWFVRSNKFGGWEQYGLYANSIAPYEIVTTGQVTTQMTDIAAYNWSEIDSDREGMHKYKNSTEGSNYSISAFKVIIPTGISTYTLYIKSDNSNYSGYAMVSKLDATTVPSKYDSADVFVHTRSTSAEKEVIFDIADTTVEHYFYVCYRKFNSTIAYAWLPNVKVITEIGTSVYEGKLAIVDGFEYEYKNNVWVNIGEAMGKPLPNVDYLFNYNAKNYNPTTGEIPNDNTTSNYAPIKSVLGNIPTHTDNYVSIVGVNDYSWQLFGSVGDNKLNIANTNDILTIVFKIKSTSTANSRFLSNRYGELNYNWLLGYNPNSTTKYYIHRVNYPREAYFNSAPVEDENGAVQIGVQIVGNAVSIYDLNDNNNILLDTSCEWGSTSLGFSWFCGGYDYNDEYWDGDFYFFYATNSKLSIEEMNDVAEYNVNGLSYPKTYLHKGRVDTSMAVVETYCDLYDATENNYIGKEALVLEEGDIYKVADNKYWQYLYKVQYIIKYNTTYGNIIDTVKTTDWGANLVANIIYNNHPTLVFDAMPTLVPQEAFKNATTLTSVDLPNSVTSIGSNAFFDCSNLTAVTIPTGLTSVEQGAFGNTYIASLTLPTTFTVINNEAFSYMKGLKYIHFKGSITSTTGWGFFLTKDIQQMYFDDVSALPNVFDNFFKFSSFEKLTEFAFTGYRYGMDLSDKGINSWTDAQYAYFFNSLGNAIDANQTIIVSIANLDKISDSTIAIAVSKGYLVAGVADAKITYTTSDNTALDDLSPSWGNAKIIANTYVNGTGTIIFDRYPTCVPKNEFNTQYHHGNLASINLPNSITEIYESAFAGSPITSINLANITKIDYGAFDSSNLTRVKISNKTELGIAVFATSIYLRNVDINCTDIPARTFHDCHGLTSLTLGENVTTINANAFDSCGLLATIYAKGKTAPSSLGEGVFNAVAEVGTLHCVEGYADVYNDWIGNYLPIGWSVIDDIADNPSDDEIWYTTVDGLPISNPSISPTIISNTYSNGKGVIKCSGTITSVNTDAFGSCTNLVSINLPSKIKNWGMYPFLSLKTTHNLTSVTINSTTVAPRMFHSQPELSDIKFNGELVEITEYCFANCSSLHNLVLPESVTSISNSQPFQETTVVNNITCYATTAPTIGDSSLTYLNENNGVLNVPNGSDYSTWMAHLPNWTINYI